MCISYNHFIGMSMESLTAVKCVMRLKTFSRNTKIIKKMVLRCGKDLSGEDLIT